MSVIERREVIRLRILKQVARLWGFKESEVELSRFDPLVNLLTGACAKELENVSQEIHSSSSRVLKRLVELLTPDVFTGALPAHAIMHARSIDALTVLEPEQTFYLTHQVQKETKDVCFSPVRNPTIFNADIKYMATGNQIYEVVDTFHKERFAEAELGKKISRSHLWLGLEVGEELSSINNMTFFFDWNLESQKETYFYLLAYTKWFTEQEELSIKPGIYEQVERGQHLADQFSVNRSIETKVFNEYQRHFVHVKSKQAFKKKSRNNQGLPFPAPFKDTFSLKDLKELPNNLLWIKVEFPESLPEEAMAAMTCQVNCFPAVNRNKKEKYYTLKNNLNILPLLIDDYFYEFIRLYNTEGFYYRYISTVDFEDIHEGVYNIRQGGIQRFDERNAYEMVLLLLDMLRDESAAFSAMGLDIFSTDIKQLNQLIARIQNKTLAGHTHKDPLTYIVVNAKDSNDSVYAQYWTTNGAFGNNIPGGSRLIQDKQIVADRNSVILVTTTKGGRNRLKPENAIKEYRRALISRNKIVTKEDVKAYCYTKLGDAVQKIVVQRGIKLDPRPGQGLLRTIDVLLVPGQEELSEQEWSAICAELERELDSLSTGILPFQVKIENIEND